MNERIKKLRKVLELNQTDFGNKIGIRQGSVAAYESGARTPIDAVIVSICREFNVNEDWLRTGDGEMFLKPETNDIVAKAARLLGGKDPMFEAFIETYITLSPSDRKVLMNFGINLVKSFHQKISN